MMKLKAEINGRQHELLVRREERLVSAEVDETSYNLEVHNPAAGEFLLRDGTTVFHCRVETAGKSARVFNVNLRGQNYEVKIIDPKRFRGLQSSGGHDDRSAQIIAPMPGKVVRLLVEVGAQVEAGAGIVVVEAMKMQNEMKSPKAGVVTSLNVIDGATVNAGDVLAEIE
ncbi:MAG TPA: biotin/lipoyl-containing protein [Pyrinomonadaceae bacterium]|nr:biotin/lipoyl-containing protein [Pyrinomonadaceae bacterium]